MLLRQIRIQYTLLLTGLLIRFERREETQVSYRGRVVSFLDRVAEEKIEPFIDKSYQTLAEMMNAYEQKMFMKREAIASNASGLPRSDTC